MGEGGECFFLLVCSLTSRELYLDILVKLIYHLHNSNNAMLYV